MGNCCRMIEKVPLQSDLLEIPSSLERTSLGINSFQLISVLGQGTFGKVLLMEKKDNQNLYAIKIIQKQRLLYNKKTTNAMTERNILAQITSPFVVKLHYAFQSPEKLYLALDFMQGGDLYYHLSNSKCFSEKATRFYAIEILLAIQDLHSKDIIYGDLKPENILVDVSGHIKLTDFNLAKNEKEKHRSNSMSGTPEYLSPEILKGVEHGKEADIWAFGCIFYEMIEGKSPFYANGYKKLFSNILGGDFNLGEKFSYQAMDLVSQLLTLNLEERMISIEKIKSHSFFYGVDWEAAYQLKLSPPLVPLVDGKRDVRYFNTNDGMDLSSTPKSTLEDNRKSPFEGFSYENSLIPTEAS